MAKSIHERVRATIEKRERVAAKRAQVQHDIKFAKLVRDEWRRSERLDALIEGRAEPRTIEEWRTVARAEGWDEGEES